MFELAHALVFRNIYRPQTRGNFENYIMLLLNFYCFPAFQVFFMQVKRYNIRVCFLVNSIFLATHGTKDSGS